MSKPQDRKEFRNRLRDLLGGEWPEPPSLDIEVGRTVDRGDHSARLLRYTVEPGERVSAWLLVPADAEPAPPGKSYPGIAVWHQHNGEYQLGKSESAGFAGSPEHHTGLNLVREGYIVLCPDAAGFEDRLPADTDGALWERQLFSHQLWAGRSLAWKNILDCRRAIDCLAALPEVDDSRIGCYGHSLGSTLSWLTAPWDDRITCVIGNCCMPSIAAMKSRSIVHSFSNTIPGLETIGDIPDVAALIAPRRLHLNFGAGDSLNPVEFIEKEMPGIAGVYESMGAAGQFSWWIDREAGHNLSAGMLGRVLSVFSECFIRPGPGASGD